MGIEAAIMFGVAALQTHSTVEAERATREVKRDTRRAGREKAAELRRAADATREEGRRLRSRQRAQYGASGFDEMGSPLFVLARTIMDTIDRQDRILRGANNVEEATRSRVRALRYDANAQQIAGFAAVGQSAATGASYAASYY